MRQGLNRLWLILILAAFCVPLFVGLGSTDLDNDEAIYSYAVDSILKTGDWLSPRSSPNEDVTFLEKPPLKFWIVAAPISLGLLPHNEFGLRFWDALFGAVAFAYVFLIGRRLAGPVCGAMALLVLFAHEPLIFDHGLRSNNMDAALMLAYCGGVYHYLRWSAASGAARSWHIAAVAAWFFLGFMTKFVAALFLPVVLGVSALAVPAQRRQLIQDWWRWALAGVAVLACAFPWFYYQYTLHGLAVWRIMFGEHVYTRFTTFADPAHLQPWHFYITAAYSQLERSGSILWIALGLIELIVQAMRRRTPEWVIVALWLMLPVTLISLGSSKLYHYLYPYLPPLALAAGAGVAWIADAANRRLQIFERLQWRVPNRVRAVAWVVTGLAIAVALGTVINDGVRLYAGNFLLFRNTSLVRPLVIAGVGIAVAASLRAGVALVAVVLVQMVLPTPVGAYADNLRRLKVEDRRLAALGKCLREVDSRRTDAAAPAGIYAPVWDAFLHPYFYYLRGTGWLDRRVDDERLHAALRVVGQERPVALDEADYIEFQKRTGLLTGRQAEIKMRGVVIVLPGPYAECASSGGR
ncbi:hypothetical protein BH24ACI5_BH24ACI5_19590 [soil metagenome]